MSAKPSWVVYRKTIHKMGSFPAVCQQGEWDAMERTRPGYHTLVRAGLSSEGEAEILARGSPRETSAPTAPRIRWWG